jgi:hypothetical protein
MRGLNVTELPDGRKAIIIRTSDRANFKSCRRKWGWSSHLKGNLGPIHLASPLWFGSAVHYALEDFHGYNLFGSAKLAFVAYCIATAKNYVRDLPSDASELFQLGQAIMTYYEDMWLKYKPKDQTYWCEDATGEVVPQVEVNFEIPVPLEDNPHLRTLCDAIGVDCVLYRGTIDRVAVDEYGHLWVVEYKTAKVIQTQHYLTDPQVTTYVWAASHIYDRPIAGVVYMQFGKKFPELPRILSSGRVSTASNLSTSYPLYRQRLLDMYGDVRKAPKENFEYLLKLSNEESEDRDKYIRRDKIRRTGDQCQSEAMKILMELEDMLNPDLPLYPNPTRECSRMCSFLSPCVSMDDGSDWVNELEMTYCQRDLEVDRLWRRRLPAPKELKALEYAAAEEMPNIELIQHHSREEQLMLQAAAVEYGGEEMPDEYREQMNREAAAQGNGDPMNASFNMKDTR